MCTSKQQACQKYIFKLHSSRIRKAGWNLTLPISEARRNDEVVSLANSQILRWLDELNGVVDAESRAREIRRELRSIRKAPNTPQNKRAVKALYAQLDEVQFKPDYLCVIMDRDKDYRRACRGFKVNGMKFKRLLGTNGGIKNKTIVFVAERHIDEIRRRIDNGRDLQKELIPAKLEAYKALVCSGSTPVSMPRGIAVVNDCITHFKSDIVSLRNEAGSEPVMQFVQDSEIELNASDGCGMMLPSLAERWSEELKLNYVMSGCNTRASFEKGMVFTFDFLDFADRVAGTRVIRDAWGDEVDLSNVELILTTSMLKLWDSYDSCAEYLRNCEENKYAFGVTKTCPRELEHERTLNYQFIQSYDLTDEQIEELISPTVAEIHDILSGDWRKTILFLKGMGLNEENIERIEDDFAKAIMIDRRMMDDPFVKSKIYSLIKKRINDAKIGVIKVHGNYSIISGDLYALCQSMFGLPVTGLLRAGEVYNRYWLDGGADKLACFRAPMSCHNNIRLVRVSQTEDARYWYRYMNTCTVMNAFDTASQALNGCDFDGDLVMLTDNAVLVDNLVELPALVCAQKKAQKCIPTEADMIQSNINSFGDDIGKITNRVTAMFDMQSRFERDSEEYKTLDYRIKCGQLYQQDAIDKAKGIISNPMPKYWYDWHCALLADDRYDTDINTKIVVDKKPYFMRYIYPAMMKQYNTYIKGTDKKASREFGMTVPELLSLPADSLSEQQRDFIHYYHSRMPVGTGNCVMNRICRRFEQEFDGYLVQHKNKSGFDYEIMKSGAEYTRTQYRNIQKLYENYNRRLKRYASFANYERVDEYDAFMRTLEMQETFETECDQICPNRMVLCDILVDLCYQHSATKRFVWDMCGEEIVRNLLNNCGGVISFPVLDTDGDIAFCGKRFSVEQKTIGGTQ